MRITADQTTAMIVDMQERLMPVIHEGDEILRRTLVLIEGLTLLEIPLLIPRQYPKGLGDTLPQIRQAVGEHQPFDKTAFSVCDCEDAAAALDAQHRKTVLVCGVEAHVCVLQTVIDLVAGGYRPVLVCDCIGSRHPYDTKIALKRAVQEGAMLTTCEAVLFELTRRAGTDVFKGISKIIR